MDFAIQRNIFARDTKKQIYVGLYSEYLLYDFDSEAGDWFMSVGFDGDGGNVGTPTEVEVLKKETLKVEGYTRRRITIDAPWTQQADKGDFWIMEGIGPCQGLLCTPQFGNEPAGKEYELTKVANLSGDVLFTPDYRTVGTGSCRVGKDRESDNVYYDLMGRPVAKLQPGSIYILNGKKVVITALSFKTPIRVNLPLPDSQRIG